ncbi:uncharacterized protein LOC126569299 [Anopheles aquasalis]|uniref:uncharacterized protein LOC126569299 n=1 Tax=Anopheles aquasalis TaxID=42839 RepID=UPI00215A90D9|nr:uncharacterized protein LOC126569299 [Anopheles aquasalis]
MAKKLMVCAFVALALVAVIQANDLILGNINAGDRILYSAVSAAAGLPGGIVSRQVNYNSVYNITAIRAYDRTLNRTGQAHLTGGGLYQRFAYLNLTTRYISNPLDFLVEIYGR